MDIQQYILNNTGIILPISGGNGQSQDQAVVIAPKAIGLYKWKMNSSAQCWMGQLEEGRAVANNSI